MKKLKTMKYYFLIVLYLLLILNSFSQNGTPILVGLYQTTVPKGKVWKLEKAKPILVEFDYFDKYSMCGAAIQSYPGLIIIRSGETPPFKVNEIYFTHLKKTAFTNGLTYSITPTEDLYFYEGTSVMVGTCLKNIQLMEYAWKIR